MNTVAYHFNALIADDMVDAILCPDAAAADIRDGPADCKGIDIRDVTVAVGFYLNLQQTFFQKLIRLVANCWIAVLQLDILLKFLEGITRTQSVLDQRVGAAY